MELNKPEVQTPNKPSLKLVGEDGNSFFIMARATRAARQAGWTKEQIDGVMEEAMSGDRDHLLCTMMDYFNCDGEYDEEDNEDNDYYENDDDE